MSFLGTGLADGNSLGTECSILIVSVSQNCFSISTRGSWLISCMLLQLPEMVRFDTVMSSFVTHLAVGPDTSHPNLLLIAVGQNSPRTVSPVTKSQ